VKEEITRRRTMVVHVTVKRDAETKNRLFNPYTGEDLGDAFTGGERAVLWTVRLHDELLYGPSGRFWNGVASAFVTLLCVSSAVVDYFWDPNSLEERPGDAALRWLTRLHFGRWPNAWLKAAWAAVGLVPAVMFVTGVVMWWNRVVRTRRLRAVEETRVAEPA